MPSVGGGGHGGGFHGGGSFGGGGGFHGGGGGYHGGPHYHGPHYHGFYYGGGIVRSVLSLILMPIIFTILGAIMLVVFFAGVNSPSANTINYDETEFQNFALDKYAEFYGTSEDGVLFVLLTSETPEDDGYYQISIVGNNVKSSVSAMFGDDRTVFGGAFDGALPASYHNSLLNAFRDALETTANSISAGNVYYYEPETIKTPEFVNEVSYINLDETYMNAALNEFVSDTGLTVSVYVADVESVFSRSNKMWFVLIVGIIFLAIGVGTTVFAVRAIKKRKEAKNNSAHMNVKTDNGGNSDGNDFNF